MKRVNATPTKTESARHTDHAGGAFPDTGLFVVLAKRNAGVVRCRRGECVQRVVIS